MAGFRFVSIVAAVGKGAPNYPLDVLAVQEVLNAHLPSGHALLALDGRCGPKTEAAIEAMERFALHTAEPDGRLDPDGPTLKALNASRKVVRPLDPARGRAPSPPAAGPINPTARPALSPQTGGASSSQTIPAAPGSLHAASRPRVAHPHPLPADVIQAARATDKKWRVPAAVTLAQWIIESGWGHAIPRGSNNPFGIKSMRGHPFVMVWTHEEINHQRVARLLPFRAFASQAEAFDVHGQILATHQNFRPAMAHASDPNGFANALTGVYATDHRYGHTLIKMMNDQNLYQYGAGQGASLGGHPGPAAAAAPARAR